MHRCLTLASRGLGKTGINPMVGTVLVRDEKILAEGFHSGFGKPHAELDLLQKYDPPSPRGFGEARQEIRSDDVLYVNLEPCVHTSKKTPPCAQLLVERGIKHVVVGMVDPNPQVAGKGIAFLRSKGVQCTGPVLLADCTRLNRGFVSLMTKGRPWITLKSARAGDGSVAYPDGRQKRITSREQDAWSHEFLRARHDAILVGVGTVIADDPTLTVRHGDVRPDVWRIVLDPHGKIPLNTKVVNGELAKKTIVVTTTPNEELSKQGVRVALVPLADSGFYWELLWKTLTTPDGDFYGISSLLVEGGKRTWETFKKSSMLDEEVLLIGD